MVLAIALGIGASMTTLTVYHVLSADPIPGKSDRLFYVQLDAQAAAARPPARSRRCSSRVSTPRRCCATNAACGRP